MQKQLAFISASQQVIHRHMLEVWEADSELKEIAGNANVRSHRVVLCSAVAECVCIVCAYCADSQLFHWSGERP